MWWYIFHGIKKYVKKVVFRFRWLIGMNGTQIRSCKFCAMQMVGPSSMGLFFCLMYAQRAGKCGDSSFNSLSCSWTICSSHSVYLCSATAFIVAYIVHTIPLMDSHSMVMIWYYVPCISSKTYVSHYHKWNISAYVCIFSCSITKYLNLCWRAVSNS